MAEHSGAVGIGAPGGVETIGVEGLGDGFDAAAVVAGEGAEVALQGDAAGGQGAEVGFLQDAQVALRVGQQRGVTRGEDGVEHVLPAGGEEVLWQFNQNVVSGCVVFRH